MKQLTGAPGKAIALDVETKYELKVASGLSGKRVAHAPSSAREKSPVCFTQPRHVIVAEKQEIRKVPHSREEPTLVTNA